ncbi:hypothetical protein [Micromonospora sp. MW-13]|uniref:hypothetical protein n=1 Tax=Micromonospora sp. MW-13 TaxID=2094022 RepID=UPI00140488F3
MSLDGVVVGVSELLGGFISPALVPPSTGPAFGAFGAGIGRAVVEGRLAEEADGDDGKGTGMIGGIAGAVVEPP